jgi:hypothetical protein
MRQRTSLEPSRLACANLCCQLTRIAIQNASSERDMVHVKRFFQCGILYRAHAYTRKPSVPDKLIRTLAFIHCSVFGLRIFTIWLSMNCSAIRLMTFGTLLSPGRSSSLSASPPCNGLLVRGV